MADPVTDAANEILARIEADVPAVVDRTVYVYGLDDMLDLTRKLKYPAIGIVYLGLIGKPDSAKLGLAATLTFDIYVVGGEQCRDRTTGAKVTTTALLHDVRNALKGTECRVFDRIGGKRKWTFVQESPVMIQDDKVDYLGYRQRWSTTVVLTNDA